MGAGQPSMTAIGVAIARARLDRPSAPAGDPASEVALAMSLLGDAPSDYRERAGSLAGGSEAWGGFAGFLSARTVFFDEAVLRAINEGVGQVVILGAGYDGRALRFRSPEVRFFEVDHRATQSDKRRRLDALGIDVSQISFAPADFTRGDLEHALDQAGHRAADRSLFVLEGVLRYLPEPWFRELLAAVARRAARGSELAVSISTQRPGDTDGGAREAQYARLAERGEPVLTVPARDTALRWLRAAGWEIDSVIDVAELDPGVPPGRLLVRAHQAK